ncbi:MAG: type II secretion system protein GspG [Gammaproteobacteria bacterium]|nr:type II secretion system protein GspG [Gammaproteobacteria bacterium]MYF02030.1 type II secretion system protein GspG [Gammaproteobacteria bacterium]MYI76839.1 type II secretion system protein GspG [Gammaproteobacteria bacterium]
MKLIKRNFKKQSKTKGFTLLEMLVVVLIIGLLVTIVVVNVAHRPDEARVKAAKAQIAQISQALDMYNLDNSQYPTEAQGLDALWEKPTGFPEPPAWGPQPYMRGKKPTDPWGGDYHYSIDDETGMPLIISYGAKGEEGGDGIEADIRSDEL